MLEIRGCTITSRHYVTPHGEAMAVPSVGVGFRWGGTPCIKQRALVYFGCNRLFYQMDRGGVAKEHVTQRVDSFHAGTHCASVWNSSYPNNRSRGCLHVAEVQRIRRIVKDQVAEPIALL
jgi:hypothetical protein